MARHYPSDPRVQSVVNRLCEFVLATGSVNSVAESLSDANSDDDQRIYPNRIHGLLSDDQTRSINSSTLDLIEHALDRVEPPTGHSDALKLELQSAVAAELATADLDEAVRRVAQLFEIPLAVVRLVTESERSAAAPPPHPLSHREPDWSWQNDAVNRCLAALRKTVTYKAGLIVPTGGGKTRIALRILLRWLAESERDDSVVLWVTHRTLLRTQARRALQELLAEGGHLPDGAPALFADRIKFVMTAGISNAIQEHGENLSLVAVDEAHHAAAASYEPIFTEASCPGLFLTATPNRADALPIGIDEIAYTITYRELFERGCVIEPIFDPPLYMPNLDWSEPPGLYELADYLLDRTEQDFSKVLVAVSKRERAELLYEALAELLDGRAHHPLAADDVAYVHGGGTSGPGTPADYLDEFAGRPSGILVSTSQLVGEGFDDPLIDAAVVTYPSESISHLMQVAGRALRYSPGKREAHVVQVRQSALEYHFEQRWLYQDISDALRPDIRDVTYGASSELQDRVTALLEAHNVAGPVRARIAHQLSELEAGRDLQLMLTGIPYSGQGDAFETAAQWGAVLVTPAERQRFVHIFNNISFRIQDLKEQRAYLEQFVSQDSSAGSLWKSYVDLVQAMEYARREIAGTPYAFQDRRNYRSARGTTWLRYVTLAFAPALPPDLELFLADAVNRGEIVASYLESPSIHAAAAKLELPLVGSQAFLLPADQRDWLLSERRDLIQQIRSVPPVDALGRIAAWRAGLPAVALPMRILDHFAQIVRPERFATQYLDLAGGS